MKWPSLKTTCYTCRKAIKNPYGKIGPDGVSHQYCFQCASGVNKREEKKKVLAKQLTLFD